MEIHMLNMIVLHLAVRSNEVHRNARALTKLRALLSREALGPAVRRGNLLDKYLWKTPQQGNQSRGEGDPQLRRKLLRSRGQVRHTPRNALQHARVLMEPRSYLAATGHHLFKDLLEDALQAKAKAYLHLRRGP